MQDTLGQALDRRGRNNNFMLLRLLAAALVIYGHSFALAAPCGCSEWVGPGLAWSYSGELGVVIFFFMSGLLVPYSFYRRQSLIEYAASRLLRLLPGLILFVLIMAFVIGPLTTAVPVADYLRDQEVWDFIRVNASLQSAVFYLPGVFGNARYGPAVDGTMWTLWIEARFYLLVAFAGAFGLLRRGPIGFVALAGLGLWMAFWPASFPFIGSTDPAFARLALYFGLGVAAFLTRDRLPLRFDLLGLVILSALLLRGRPEYPFLLPAIIGYAVIFIAYLPTVNLPSWFGDYSYGCYLYGWPIQQLLASNFPEMGPYKMAVIALPLSILCGAISWHLVESRALRMKPRPVETMVKPAAQNDTRVSSP